MSDLDLDAALETFDDVSDLDLDDELDSEDWEVFFNEFDEEFGAGVQTNGTDESNTEVPLMGKEDDLNMKLEKNITPAVTIPAKFESVTLTFTSEAEYHDFVAALAAYGRKLVNVSGTSIAADYGLTAYTGNARRTVNQLITRLP